MLAPISVSVGYVSSADTVGAPVHVHAAFTFARLPPVNTFNSPPEDVAHTLGLHAGRAERESCRV